tara:strand:+ start:121 stop:327 length:207 start_codon:yes stop_codon:yes gene_type:complete
VDFGANPLKFNFWAVVVTVCSMKKPKKSSGYPLFKIPEKKLGLGHDISFANGDIKLISQKKSNSPTPS